MSALTDLTAAIEQLVTDGELYNAIVHGPATGEGSTVTTTSGEVKTFAKLQADLTATSLASMLTLFGVPTYANLTAANAALAIGMPYYDTALSKLQITTE